MLAGLLGRKARPAAVAQAAPAHASAQPVPPSTSAASGCARLAVIGDVHGQWNPQRDEAALHALAPDVSIFVGDLGNEDVPLVQSIAAMRLPKFVLLGNHDAFYSLTARPRGRARAPSVHNRSAPQQAAAAEDAAASEARCYASVLAQLEALGEAHVGYAASQLLAGDAGAASGLHIVGARPFSKGGKAFQAMQAFLGRLYGVATPEDSAAKMLGVVRAGVPRGAPWLLLGHNGPAGLGGAAHDICGVDWKPEQGDHGDPDLALLLAQLRAAGEALPFLCLHGHMHHALRHGGRRRMAAVQGATVFLNAATVPRLVHVERTGAGELAVTRHHFLLVDVVGGQARAAADVWVEVSSSERSSAGGEASQQGAARQQPAGDVPASLAALRQQLRRELPSCWALQPPCCDEQRHGGLRVRVASVSPVLLADEGDTGGVVFWDAWDSLWRRAQLEPQEQQPATAATAAAAAAGAAPRLVLHEH